MEKQRKTLFLMHGGQEIHHTYKAGRAFPMSYWYSTDGSKTEAEGHVDDCDTLFDVRSLPEQYKQGLDIEGRHAERKDHCEALKRAIDDGYQLVRPASPSVQTHKS